MTTTERTDRDLQVWRLCDIMGRITPVDMTDAELTAAIAIFSLADVRKSPKPVFLIKPYPVDLDLDEPDGNHTD
jgi:hypothetical protein